MSYVPPHLRAAAATATAPHSPHSHRNPTSKPIPETLDNDRKLSSLNPKPLSLPHDSPISTFSNASAARRAAATPLQQQHARAFPASSAVPDPVFQQWKPSDRVFRLEPEQVWFFASAPFLSSVHLFFSCWGLIECDPFELFCLLPRNRILFIKFYLGFVFC